MRTAVYARKSADDNERAAQDKSVDRQVAHAREYFGRKGWTVADEHVCIDDGISGAEFKNRPALLKMLALVRDATLADAYSGTTTFGVSLMGTRY